MASAALDALIAEIHGALVSLGIEVEGLADYARLNLKPETLQVVQEASAVFVRRQSLLGTVAQALDQLAADGYPDLPSRNVNADVIHDLDEQILTITAAREKFKSEAEAVGGVMTFDAPKV